MKRLLTILFTVGTFACIATVLIAINDDNYAKAIFYVLCAIGNLLGLKTVRLQSNA